MDPDEQKKQTKESKLFKRHKSNVGHVLFTTRLRLFIQDVARSYWQLLGYRYHILLLIRGILAIVLAAFQIF
jgi:hypothetical protein